MHDPAPPVSRKRWSPRGAHEALQPIKPPGPPEPPRRRGGGLLSKLSAFFTLLVFLTLAGGAALIYGQSQVNAPGPLAQDKIVLVPKGSGLQDIAQILEQEGVINQPVFFQVMHYVLGAQKLLAGDGQNLRFGEYQFKQYASIKEVRDTLIEGRSIQHSITIPEGLTSEQIVNRLRENEVLEGEVKTVPREGSLLPDTYRFGRGYSRSQLLAQMEREQKKILQEVWARRSPDIPVKTANDLVTLASIVEKETGRADERSRVASVFVNRLNRGMRLESDPTIIYGLVGGKGSLGRGILSTEIRQPTAYNTYVINGLPPGPIANPGRAALEATANPSKTRDIFFVADGTGGHAFAETLEQHNRNVVRWRQLEGGGGAAQTAPLPATPVNPTPVPGRPGQRSDLLPPAFAPPSLQGQPRTSARLNQVPSPSGNASAYVVPEAHLEVFAPIIGAVPGVGTAGIGTAGVDGTNEQPPVASGNVESYPVTPGRRQTIQRNASQAGINPGPVLQNDSSAFAEAAEFGQPPASAAKRGPHKGFDAVEGTARDPLRNKSFDLSSPKTVPALR